MKHILLFLCFLLVFGAVAQTGTIKGRVLDQQSELSLIGANVIIQGSDPIQGATTDLDGYFRIEQVKVGRHSIQVSFLGYEPITIPNLVLTAGKELDIEVKLTENVRTIKTFEVVGGADKDRANNELATMSARQFSLEEVQRYSGGRGDVARLASNFAGVSSPDDSRNDIVVRGNSPTGVLWRIDGIPVPNPNHYSTFGTTGGPVSALNPNMMKNSDFITSAFPAEYGNALAGVFDISFRSGNKDTTEFSVQAGAFSGLELMAEGPLGNNRGSYLVAGRYSLVGLIGGAAGTEATPVYSDLSVKLDLGKSKLGRFELFGIAGVSTIEFIGAELDSTDIFAQLDEDGFYDGYIYTGGLTHTKTIGDKAYIKTTVGGSLSGNSFESDRYFDLDAPDEYKVRYFETSNEFSRMTFSTKYNAKLNARATFRAGLLAEYETNVSYLRDRENQPDNDGDGLNDMTTIYDIDGSYSIVQPYAQLLYRLGEKWKLNGGVHGQYFDLNEQIVVEPRVAAEYQVNTASSLKLGYGLHHQPGPGPILFSGRVDNGQFVNTNSGLDMVRSQHYVLGYDLKFSENWRVKAEVYRQEIDKALVDRTATSYSSLTEGADFAFSTDKTDLVNNGTGYSQGVELTLEKFFSNNYYVLMTGSFFEAKFEGSDGVERNSPFNNGYVLNFLAGREFPLDGEGRRLLTLDTKFTTAGGRYYTPIDLEASQAAGTQVDVEEEAFSLQNDAYLRWDLKIGARFNSKKKKVSHQFYFDLQNLLDTENIFVRRYNRRTGMVNTVYQQGFFPDFGYRVQF